MAGLSATGFTIPLMPEIQASINESLTTNYGANIDLSPNGPLGQICGIIAEREYLIWEALQDVYNSQYPNTAFGTSLDNVCAISGIARLNALASTIDKVNLFGTAGTVIPAASTQFAVVNSPTSIFKPTSDVTLVSGQDCIQTITFSAVPTSGSFQIVANGQTSVPINWNALASDLQTAIRALLFCSGCTVVGSFGSGFTVSFHGSATGGLQLQNAFQIINDTLVISSTPITGTITITQPGIDQATVNMIAISTGPIVAGTNSLTQIVTPVSGLNQVLNVNAALVGRNVETDNAYRARRAIELQIAGAGTFDSILSKLAAVSGVEAVVLFENATNSVDGNGLPAHSFEAFVLGGSDQDIGNTIWSTKPLAIQSFGSIPVTVLDILGGSHSVSFSRPNQVLIYLIVNITVDSNYPANGDTLIKEALVSYGSSLGIGGDVIVVPKLISQLAPIPGIDDAVILIGTAPSPTLSDNINIGSNEISIWDAVRISVNHV